MQYITQDDKNISLNYSIKDLFKRPDVLILIFASQKNILILKCKRYLTKIEPITGSEGLVFGPCYRQKLMTQKVATIVYKNYSQSS